MTLGLEKRTGRRIPINCSVQILLPDGRELLGLAHDLSVEGVRFDCPIQLQPAQVLEVRLLPPSDSGTPPFQATIDVIRCEATDTPSRFMVAAALRATK
jgi:PilZ domain